MKLELNVQRLLNDDVIATSCESTHLYAVIADNPTPIDLNLNDLYTGNAACPSEVGFYHLVDGKFVPCPTWNGKIGSESNTLEVYIAHDISG